MQINKLISPKFAKRTDLSLTEQIGFSLQDSSVAKKLLQKYSLLPGWVRWIAGVILRPPSIISWIVATLFVGLISLPILWVISLFDDYAEAQDGITDDFRDVLYQKVVPVIVHTLPFLGVGFVAWFQAPTNVLLITILCSLLYLISDFLTYFLFEPYDRLVWERRIAQERRVIFENA